MVNTPLVHTSWSSIFLVLTLDRVGHGPDSRSEYFTILVRVIAVKGEQENLYQASQSPPRKCKGKKLKLKDFGLMK